MSTSDISHLPADDSLVALIDGGGTHFACRWFSRRYERRVNDDSVLHSADFTSVEAALASFFTSYGIKPGRVVLVLPGPVRPDNAPIRLTNLPDWPPFSAEQYLNETGIDVFATNDMTALCAGTTTLERLQVINLKSGKDVPRSTVLTVTLSTGVGDGVAIRPRDDKRYLIAAVEGGHITWQPCDAAEDDYLNWLRRQYDCKSVSVERAISGGQGLRNLWDFLGQRSPELHQEAEAISLQVVSQDIGPAITAGALAGNQLCERVMQLFGSILGGYLRDRALTTLPWSGIRLVGGVATAMEGRVMGWLVKHTDMLERFLGGAGVVHADILNEIRVDLVLDTDVALRGLEKLAIS